MTRRDPVREAFITDIPREVYQLWEPGDRQIAQLEMVTIIYALTIEHTPFGVGEASG